MRRVDREIMWGNTKKSGLYPTPPKHFIDNFRGTDWHWYDVNDCWCFADEWLGKPVKVDVYGAGDEAEFVLNGKSLGRKPIEKLMASPSIYKCLSCFACVERCPRDVEPAKLVEAIRLAVIRQQGQNHLKAKDIPDLIEADPDLPQQALVTAFRKYTK